MTRTPLILASLFALTAVLLGAFGAHGLRVHLDASQLSTFETGVRYQFYHAMALFVTGILGQSVHHIIQGKLLPAAAWCFALGIVLFSGSLYLLACRDLLSTDLPAFVGALTPLGGLLFIIGWLLVLLSQLRK